MPNDPPKNPHQLDDEFWDEIVRRNRPAARRYGVLAATLSLLALVALTGAVVAMLRSDDAGPAPASASLSGEGSSVLVYRYHAARICSGALRVDELFAPATADQLAAALELSLSTSARPTVDQLAELVPPREFTEFHSVVVQTGRAQIQVIDGLAEGLRTGAEPRAAARSAAARLDRLQLRSNAAFAAMGVQECVASARAPIGSDSG